MRAAVAFNLLKKNWKAYPWRFKHIALWKWLRLHDSSLQVWRVRLEGSRARLQGVKRESNPYRDIYAPFDIPAWFEGYDK